ncbi:MAG: DUF1152 domain-containing protein [Pseudonocardia sp.]|nr:DUF1152 domain-containing protein [Pseudonocardia sp.]
MTVRPLLVASGGGGDALAALLVSRDSTGHPAPVVASYSWDRFLIDPRPGPRSVEDFDRVTTWGDEVLVVLPGSELRGQGRSTLSLLARETAATVVLLDPAPGARGLRRQIAEAASLTGATSIRVVDVGGDIIAQGDEPSLKSPLADSLILAAVLDQILPVSVVVAGPGLDGELPPDYVVARAERVAAHRTRLSEDDVRPYLGVLRSHPSEAATLLAAAALGVTGAAEIRDSAPLVSVSPASADVYEMPLSAAVALNPLAAALAQTRTLGEAEQVLKAEIGGNELDYERAKAARTPLPDHALGDDLEVRRSLHRHLSAARERGATLTSFRRLTEALGPYRFDPDAVRLLLGELGDPDLTVCHLFADRVDTRGTRGVLRRA